MEVKGKIDTTYAWTCETCSADCRVTDAPMICANCGKVREEAKFLRHFKLVPEPIRLGFRPPGH